MLLTVLFLVLPLVELWVVVAAAQAFGVPETMVVLVLVSVAGAYLCKWAGLGVLMRMQKTVRGGGVPTREVVDGFLVLMAGALMLVPGFISDVMALGLLFPPTRAIARRAVLHRYRGRLERYGVHDGATVTDTVFAYRGRRGDVLDVDGYVVRTPRSAPPDRLFELGP